MKIEVPDRSIILNSTKYVQSICQYMFDELDFTHFDYGHYYDDGRTFHLINDAGSGSSTAFVKKYYADGIYVTVDEIEHLRNKYGASQHLFGFLTPEFAFTDDLPTKEKHREQIEISQAFYIGNRVYFNERFKDYFEIVGFGSNRQHVSFFYNFCVRNMAVLQNFIKYFREQAKDIIEKAKKESLLIEGSSTYKPHNINMQNFVGYDFNKGQKIDLCLTRQETASLQQLASGKTFKEAAKNLLISPRTVESYVHNIKVKIGCQSTHELLEIFSKLAR